MDDILSELRKIAEKRDPDEDFLMMKGQYKSIILDAKNFHEIPADKGKMCAVIDGGNAILLDSPMFALGFIRLASLKYSGNRRIQRNIQEFYVLVKYNGTEYIVLTHPKNTFDMMSFDPDDQTLKDGKDKTSPSRIISLIRRYAELELASKSEGVDFILLDGTLEARYPHEFGFIKNILMTGKAIALSKTCSLTTKQGYPITKKLYDMADEKKIWYYNPIVINNNKDHDAELSFVKLNANSDYVFRLETQRTQDVGKAASALAANSNDAIFLGYPYMLIDADSAARVSDDEAMMLRTSFASKLGKQWIDLSRHLKSMNAHDMLDNIRF